MRRFLFWLPEQPEKAPGKHSVDWPQHRVRELEGLLGARRHLVQVFCHASEAEHPVWWTDGVPGECPWCQIGQLREQIKVLEAAPVAAPHGLARQEPIVSVNEKTQAVAVSSLWAAIGEDRTAMLPAVDDPSAAVHLQPAADTVPPKPRQPPLPPAHLVEQQLVIWKPKLPGDPLASDDLKTVAPATGVPGTGGWQSVQLTR